MDTLVNRIKLCFFWLGFLRLPTISSDKRMETGKKEPFVRIRTRKESMPPYHFFIFIPSSAICFFQHVFSSSTFFLLLRFYTDARFSLLMYIMHENINFLTKKKHFKVLEALLLVKQKMNNLHFQFLREERL